MKSAWSRGRGKPGELRMDAASVAARERMATAKKLRAFLVASGETTDWIAGKIGVPFVRASALLSGSVIPSEGERQRIAALLESGDG